MGGSFNEESIKVYLNHLLDRRYYYYDTEYVRSKTVINLNSDEIMSAQEASRIWGKSESYVRISLRQNPDKWPEGSYRRFGKTIIVTVDGMEAVTGQKDPRKDKSEHLANKERTHSEHHTC